MHVKFFWVVDLVIVVVVVCDSVTIVLAYLMNKSGMRFVEAMEHVRSRRPEATPNIGFIQQLLKLEETLLGKL